MSATATIPPPTPIDLPRLLSIVEQWIDPARWRYYRNCRLRGDEALGNILDLRRAVEAGYTATDLPRLLEGAEAIADECCGRVGRDSADLLAIDAAVRSLAPDLYGAVFLPEMVTASWAAPFGEGEIAGFAQQMKALYARLLTLKTGPRTGSPDDALVSAENLAAEIGQTVKPVRVFLRRFWEKRPDCRIPNAAPRKGDPRYLYRRGDVLPALRTHFH